MLKKTVSMLLAVVLVLGIPLSGVAEEKNAFSIEECVELALEGNVKLKIKAQDYDMSKVERSEAKWQSNKIDRARDDLKSVPLHYLPPAAGAKLMQAETLVFGFEGAQGKDVAPKLKEAEELIAKKGLDLEKQNLRIDVERTYYNVLMAEDNVKTASLQLDRSKEQLKNATVSYKNGVVAKDSLLMAEAGLASSEQNLFTAEKNLKLAKMSLNKLMGRELNTPLALTTQFTHKPEVPDSVDSMIQSALKLRPEVVGVREMAEVTKLNRDTALNYYSKNAFVYRKAEVDAEKAELGLTEAQESVKLAVSAAYLDLQEAAEKLKAAEKVKNLARESYRITELKYKSQMATTAEFLEAGEKLYGAELMYTASVFDYNVASAELANWAGKGLEEK